VVSRRQIRSKVLVNNSSIPSSMARAGYTVLIPTHERPQKLERLLKYLAEYQCNVLVVDSSSEPIDASQYKNIIYLHDPLLSFKEKVSVGTGQIRTEFTVLAADDDFPIIENIEKHLKSEVDFSSMIGRIVQFNELSKRKRFWYQKNMEKVGRFSGENATEFMANYSQVLWGCFKTSSLRRCFSDMQKVMFNNDNFIELFLACWMLGEDGIYKVDTVLCAREVSPSDHWGARHTDIRKVYHQNTFEFLQDYSNVHAILGSLRLNAPLAVYLSSISREECLALKIVRKVLERFGLRRYIDISQKPELSKLERFLG
jgi:glycosyltransferase domain-containing protein